MKHKILTVILLVLAVAFALEGTCGIGMRELASPLTSRETVVTLYKDVSMSSPSLPFKMKLKSFDIVFCSAGHRNDASRTKNRTDSTPKQFTSTLEIDGNEYVTSVNHPCRYGKWSIYQYDYDSADGQYSVVKVIEQSPAGWAIVISVLISACIFLIYSYKPSGKRVLATIATLATVITVISLAGISLKALPPALRSPFFIPHILMYTIAYALLTISVFSPKYSGSASALLLIGLLLGSIWAKLAWGNFWQWDVKECWAAATWFLSAAACLQAKKGSRLCFLLLAVFAFLAMNMTWYGVNWLPGAASSPHIY